MKRIALGSSLKYQRFSLVLTGLIGIILVYTITSCSVSYKIKDCDYKVDVSIKEYQRDSIFLKYTLDEYVKTGYSDFKGLIKPIIYIDTIVYSPNKLKFISLIIIKTPNENKWSKENHPKADFLFDGRAFVGFRDDEQSLWKTYEFSHFLPSGWTSYIKVHNLHCHYYFATNNHYKESKRLNNSSETVWHSDLQSLEFEKILFFINEKAFWENSVVWRKGARIPGLYNFQTKGNIPPNDKYRDPVMVMPKIEYPREILDLFK